LRRSRPYCEAFFAAMIEAGIPEQHPDLAQRCLDGALYFGGDPLAFCHRFLAFPVSSSRLYNTSPVLFAMCRKAYNGAIVRSSQQQLLAAIDMLGGWTRLLRARATPEPRRRANNEHRQSDSMHC
jgi:hypothetical protein